MTGLPNMSSGFDSIRSCLITASVFSLVYAPMMPLLAVCSE